MKSKAKRYSTEKIETKGIDCFKNFIFNSKLIIPRILEHDTTESWDGELLFDLFDSLGVQSQRKIPIQIKSSNKEPKEQEKHDIKKKDILNYLSNGGVMFIKISFLDKDHFAIYLNNLLPVKLKQILAEMERENKRQRKIILEKVNDHIQFENLCVYFIKNSQLQYNIDNIKSANQIANQTSLIIHSSSPEFKIKNFFSEDAYLYAVIEGDIKIPLLDKILEVKGLIRANVSVGSAIFFDQFEVIHQKNSTCIRVSDCIRISKSLKGEAKLEFEIIYSSSFLELWNSSRFYIECKNSKEFIIGDLTVKFPNVSKDQKLLELFLLVNKLYEFFKKYKIDMNFVKVEHILRDADFLDDLVDRLLYQKSKKIKDKKSNFIHIYNIYSRRIITILISKNDQDYQMYDFFLDFPESDKFFALPEVGMYTSISRFISLDLKNVNETLLFDIDYIIKDFKLYLNPSTGATYTNYALYALQEYDINKSQNFLRLAKSINSLLRVEKVSNIKKIIYIINKYQIIRRMRELQNFEIKFLQLLLLKDFDLIFKCGIYAILEDEDNFHKSFGQLSEINQKEFSSYPIMNLIE